MACVGLLDQATSEYRKGIEIAQRENSKDALKAIYLQWTLSMAEEEAALGLETRALNPINSYIVLDESNQSMFVSGVRLLQMRIMKVRWKLTKRLWV
jgi:hypothetical protein